MIKAAFLLFCSLTFITPATADWHEVKSDNFIVYADAELEQAKKLVEDLEVFRSYLASLVGIEPQSISVPLEIYWLKSNREYRKLVNSRTLGVYTTTQAGPVAAVNGKRNYRQPDLSPTSVLFHEYVHHFMYQFSNRRYPRWYREGYADFLATYKKEGDIYSVGGVAISRLQALVLKKGGAPTRCLLRYGLRDVDSGTGCKQLMFYPQAWATTYLFMIDEELSQKFPLYMDMLLAGKEPVKAFEDLYGFSIKVIREKVYELRTKRLFRRLEYKFINSDTAKISAKRMDKREITIAKLKLLKTFDTRKHEKSRSFSRFKNATKNFKGDPEILALYAWAHETVDRLPDGLTMLQKLPSNIRSKEGIVTTEAMIEMDLLSKKHASGNSSKENLARMTTLRRPILEHLKTNPLDLYARYLFSYSLVHSSKPNIEGAIKILTDLYNLYPQFINGRFLFGQAYMLMGEKHEACLMLDGLYWNTYSQITKKKILDILQFENETLLNCAALKADYPDAG